MLSGKIAAAVLVAGSLLSIAGPASALPLSPGQPFQSAGTAIEHQVGWRCGRGWHMNGWGQCVPNRARRGPGLCGPGWHLNRFGACVPNRRW